MRNYELLGRYVQTKVQESQGIVGELHTGPFSAPNWLADHNWQPAGGPVQARIHCRSCSDGNQGSLCYEAMIHSTHLQYNIS